MTTQNPVGSVRPARSGKPNHWELRVGAGPDPLRPGKYRQVTRTVGPCDRKGAMRALLKLSDEVEEELARRDAAPTFGLLLDRWIDTASRVRQSTTVREYRRIIERRLKPRFGDLPLTEITTELLDRFYGELIEEGLAPASINQVHAVIRRAYNQAITWGLLEVNPTRGTTRPTVYRPPLKVLSVADVEAIVRAAEESDPELATMLVVAATVAPRRGELCGLRWSDWSPADKRLRIQRSIRQTPKSEGGWTCGPTKTYAWRDVAVRDVLTRRLAAHHRAMRERAQWAGVTLRPDAYMFSRSPDGSTPLWPDWVTAGFQRAARRAGVKGARLHDLRHFCATQHLVLGAPVHTVQQLLGHRDAVTTMNVYGHAMPTQSAAAADAMDALLSGLAGRADDDDDDGPAAIA